MSKHHQEKRGLVPYHTLSLATQGDIEAIEAILQHYRSYIITLAIKQAHDQYGSPYCIVDEHLRCRLEAKLITTILNFKIA
jgi:hypothetical protein